jgi:AraC-like DNA-binding protein
MLQVKATASAPHESKASPGSAMDPRVERVIGIMNEHLADHLSEQNMSRSVNLSPSRLRQLFKKETGVSPMRYVKGLRMKRAATLLRTSFLTVKEVIFQSWSGDVSHFVRDFKKEYGLTPSEFRLGNKTTSKGAGE